MADLTTVALRISNYKCFGEAAQGYDQILPINLIIGRNNSGKSTLLDLIDYAVEPKELIRLGHKGQVPKVTLTDTLTEEELRSVFSPNASGGGVPGPGTHWDFGQKWVGARLTVGFPLNKEFNFVSLEPPFNYANFQDYEHSLAIRKTYPFQRLRFRRLSPDRDIRPEPDENERRIQPNGTGATNVIQSFINKAALPRELVEDTLLHELNLIFEPDAQFTDIIVRQLGDGTWEVYLGEIGKGRIPLSHTGSGVKTILLVLAFLYLIPVIDGRDLSDYLFGFEELENNLHPALQRRLLTYLRQVANTKGCRFFLTTHSNVAIDLFARDPLAQIIHVTHNRECAAAKRVTTYIDNRGVLDDLGIRASDILQANGIVWVEGPSDKLYFNRWVELVSGGKLQEGVHYQCVFYGGKVLAHLSGDDPDINVAEALKILRVNRNAILIADSDQKQEDGPIREAKQRILAEVQDFGGMAWLTFGKEIENYIPHQALNACYPESTLPELHRYQDIGAYLDKIRTGEGKRFRRNKVVFAERVCAQMTLDCMIDRFDLLERVREACTYIRSWNG
jgi:hypothetical protein